MKVLKKNWMEILLVVIVIGVIYYLFGGRVWEAYTTKQIHTKDEIKKLKNDYLTKKGEYEKADRAYNEELNTYTAPAQDFTAGDPRIPIPYPTSPLRTIQNRDGNDPYKVCGDKFLNYQKMCVADNLPPGASIKSDCTAGTDYGVYKLDGTKYTLLYNAINGTCLTSNTANTSSDGTSYFVNDPNCPVLKKGTYVTSGNPGSPGDLSGGSNNTITNPAYKSNSNAVPPSQIPGCSAHRLAKKIEMDNAWADYSPYAKRKKSRRRSWWRR